MVAAYNSNSVRARNLMTNVRRDDVLVQEMPCVARVRVGKAFFMPGYGDGGGGVPAPFMRMTGTVASLFIEDDDDRMFPCNDKEIQMMDSESVMIDYLLSPEEIASLAQKGMFHDPLFKPPANLEGNVIEIPVNVVYRGIYETPVCFVEIVKPLELATSTKDNNYYGLFEACEPSPVVQAIKDDTYEYTQFNQPAPEAAPTFEDFPKEEDLEREREERRKDRGVRIGLEDPERVEQKEDDDIFGKVDQEISEAAAKAAQARESVDRQKIAAELLHPARKDFRQEKDAKAAAAANEFKMYDFAGEDSGGEEVARPDPETRASNIYDQLRTRAEAMRQAQEDGGGESEAGIPAEDGEPQGEAQEGFLPVGDFSAEGGEDGKITTPEQRAKAEAAKQQRINRMVDRAEDLKAMNEGRTDTAGFGSGDDAPAPTPAEASRKAVAARSMLERLRERQNQAAAQAQAVEQAQQDKQDGGQQYL